MLVELSTTLVWKGYAYHSGDQVDLPSDLALRYVQAGSAEIVEQPVETAALQTTAPKGRNNGRTQAGRS